MSIALTFDTDWVHDVAILDTISLLDKYSIKGTFFATHKYDCLSSSTLKHEVGLHPNFNPTLHEGKRNIYEVIDEIISIYPNAKGFRSHSLTVSSSILNYFFLKGLKYDSNQFHPAGSEVYEDFSGLHRFTHNYVDLGHLLNNMPLKLENINLNTKFLNILIFHPIHIFINTPSISFYEKIKNFIPIGEELKKNINTSEFGIRDLFIELLKYISNNKINTTTLYQNLKENKYC